MKNCLLQCIPHDMRNSKISIQKLQSQFMDKLNILTLRISDKTVNEVMAYLVDNISNLEVLEKYFTSNLDIEEKVLHLRFDKFLLLDGELQLTRGNDIVKCEISYTTYEQKENTLTEAIDLFKSVGLLK